MISIRIQIHAVQSHPQGKGMRHRGNNEIESRKGTCRCPEGAVTEIFKYGSVIVE